MAKLTEEQLEAVKGAKATEELSEEDLADVSGGIGEFSDLELILDTSQQCLFGLTMGVEQKFRIRTCGEPDTASGKPHCKWLVPVELKPGSIMNICEYKFYN